MRLGGKERRLSLYLILRELRDNSKAGGDTKLVSAAPLEEHIARPP